MNTQQILTRVIDAARPFEAIKAAQDSRDVNPWDVAKAMHERLEIIRADLEAQVRMECAKSSGTASATRIVNALLKDAKADMREALHWAWIDADGRQCVTDGYRAYRLREPLPLEPRPENAPDPVDLAKIFPNAAGMIGIPMPSVQEIKAHIALERAKMTGKKTGIIWDFGPGHPAVNAQYLLELAQLFPDAAEIFHGVNLFSPLYIRGERGDAVLLPIRTNRAVADMAAARKAREQADAELKARAAAEGKDWADLKEREERRAKHHARAVKELENAVAKIRNEQSHAARHGYEHSMELDEFEYLVYLMTQVKRYAS